MKTKEKIQVYEIKPYYIVYWNEDSGEVRVISNSKIKKGGELLFHKNPYGYLRCKINGKPFLIHQFIGEILFGPKKNGYCINHIDGNKLNNSKNNLEYITIKENIKHAVKLGLHVSARPERHGNYKDGRALKNNIKQYKSDWYYANKKK